MSVALLDLALPRIYLPLVSDLHAIIQIVYQLRVHKILHMLLLLLRMLLLLLLICVFLGPIL